MVLAEVEVPHGEQPRLAIVRIPVNTSNPPRSVQASARTKGRSTAEACAPGAIVQVLRDLILMTHGWHVVHQTEGAVYRGQKLIVLIDGPVAI